MSGRCRITFGGFVAGTTMTPSVLQRTAARTPIHTRRENTIHKTIHYYTQEHTSARTHAARGCTVHESAQHQNGTSVKRRGGCHPRCAQHESAQACPCTGPHTRSRARSSTHVCALAHHLAASWHKSAQHQNGTSVKRRGGCHPRCAQHESAQACTCTGPHARSRARSSTRVCAQAHHLAARWHVQICRAVPYLRSAARSRRDRVGTGCGVGQGVGQRGVRGGRAWQAV